jgi:hypothetical protein
MDFLKSIDWKTAGAAVVIVIVVGLVLGMRKG